MKKIMFLFCTMLTLLSTSASSKTLVVYYSYTGNCREIVTTLTSQIQADVLEIQPAEKGLKYEANNYALGTQLLNAIKANPNDAGSYPAIDPVTTSLNDYETIIIVTPLWWSQMAANMQTYLFNYGSQLAGKNIGLIVSSASSGISGVVDDCKRLVPDGKYFSENLWINHSNHSNRATLIQNWLSAINYNTVTGINETKTTTAAPTCIYDLGGRMLVKEPSKGIYIKNGKKVVIK
ncbi:Flavodoxin [Prevotella sp. ne3005]|uniref:flavodoxin n=1 Tax=Prevotella sp. ne3005 TaxID=1761887 RepID=UPI0008B31AB0|nr:flavodoxin [Prevotella sp. ne3005]SEM94103.1 Flavodoxin [Prevotella sp. ne3005]